MAERWHDEDAERDYRRENPADDRALTVGRAWYSTDGEFWFPANSEAGALYAVLCWLAWVARGCRSVIFTEVDYENGIVTLSSSVEEG